MTTSDVVVIVRYPGYTRRAIIRQYRINPGWHIVKWIDADRQHDSWHEPPSRVCAWPRYCKRCKRSGRCKHTRVTEQNK